MTAQLDELARDIAAYNADPQQNIGYLGEDADTVVAELPELDYDPVFAAARDDSRMVGLLRCARPSPTTGTRRWIWSPRVRPRGAFTSGWASRRCARCAASGPPTLNLHDPQH